MGTPMRIGKAMAELRREKRSFTDDEYSFLQTMQMAAYDFGTMQYLPCLEEWNQQHPNAQIRDTPELQDAFQYHVNY